MIKWITGVLFVASLSSSGYAKKISLSFDDVPRRNTSFTGKERSIRLLKSLKDAGVDRAVFYVNTAKASEEGKERIRRYYQAGHIVGNHTHSHPSANRVGRDVFLEDFETAHRLLTSWGYKPTYFRYPFLHRSKETNSIIKIRNHILSKGYVDGFVTVDNYDWHMDNLFQEAKKQKRPINMDNLKKFYVDTLYKGIEHYEDLAKRVYGHSPAHVMLLHENDLAALFVGDLVKKLRDSGWQICSPEESYQDKYLAPFPSTVTRHGQGRIVAHATDKKIPKPLVSGLEDERTLEILWDKYRVTTIDVAKQ